MPRHCRACGHPLAPLRWWQRGPLRPLDLCPYADGRECTARGLARMYRGKVS